MDSIWTPVESWSPYGLWGEQQSIENFNEPPPELVEGEEVYEVETILKHRLAILC
jgi:hypothetical protein